MPLIKDGQEVADPWRFVADGEPLPADGAVLITLARWQAERDALLSRGTPLGVQLASRDKASELADDLPHLALITLEFPTFRDGRAYSTARLLRERFGFTGELRAVGNVLHDQLLFMHRCGFNAFEVADARAVEIWQRALAEISVFFQPTGDGRATVHASRRQERRAAP